ncbi:amidohydrolase [Tamlana sp. 2201CG12-4]|uniref:amidohydrolase n=1 Tax=Tamlana sp. 2201CG12-4 TaxID=3112582 RepID=UPI002DBF3DCB|nr:amidohydrolase [Tamlana sp. 2201CG12-4]MEC3906078.1 amidohydrolase [Tamlana sp. 2201CG12-4]
MKTFSIKLLMLLTLTIVACKNSESKSSDETIDSNVSMYYGGDILTMEKMEPTYVESVVTKDGKIAFTGSQAEAEKLFKNAKKINLEGKTLIPGFIDSHSHFSQTAIKLSLVNLDPSPAGNVNSIEDIKNALAKELADNPEKYKDESSWLLGWGFDNAMLAEERFPTRKDLDEISTEYPISLIHFSSHMMAMNSLGLERAGYLDKGYVVPEGGVMQRFEDSNEYSGVIEEQAMLAAMNTIGEDISGVPGKYVSIPLPDEDMKKMLLQAQDLYIKNGFTTVTDMATTDDVYRQISDLAESNRLKVDVGMAYYSLLTTPENVKKLYAPDYKNHYRVIGGKLNLDGGTPGRTAYLRQPYHTPTHGQPADYRGYSSITDQKDMNDLVGSYYELEVPFFIHALGDAAVDQCIDAVKYSEEHFNYDNSRTQIIHAQQVQPDQFESLKDLDVTFTFQITHNFYFADFHNEYILGPERTARLNPAKDALNSDFSVTIHHDSPVHPVDQISLMWIATNRASRSGKVYGEDQRLTAYEALYASTMAGAYQFKEENIKGSLEAGKLADLVILDKNPLKTDIQAIKDIQVLETIKEGESVYKK